MNPSAVPTPRSARAPIASAGSGAIDARTLPSAITARPAAQTRAGPSRSLRRPAGSCMSRWVRKSTAVNSPITPSEVPYASARSSATAPVSAMFQPAEKPTALPPATARLLMRGARER